MPDILVFPPHIIRAKAALLSAGFTVEPNGPAFAALMFATIAYERSPQFNHAVRLQNQLTLAERENRRLTAELLREAIRADRLYPRLSVSIK